jgi:hypothetical protein
MSLTTTFFSVIDQATKSIYQFYWHALLSFLSKYTLYIIIFSLSIFILSLIIYKITGRWAMLGSILYWYLYFGILFFVGLIWGSGIFVNNIFNLICTIFFNPVCYLAVRAILNKAGIRKHEYHS